MAWNIAQPEYRSVASFAMHLRYTLAMKTASIPSVRVAPAFRAEMEAVLGSGETLSQFVESSVLEAVQRRRNQAEFLARGMASLVSAQQSGTYVEADAVIGRLEQKLAAAKARR